MYFICLCALVGYDNNSMHIVINYSRLANKCMIYKLLYTYLYKTNILMHILFKSDIKCDNNFTTIYTIG